MNENWDEFQRQQDRGVPWSELAELVPGDGETFERLPEPTDLAWGVEDNTRPVRQPRSRVWAWAVAITLVGIIIGGVILGAFLAYPTPPVGSNWPTGYINPPTYTAPDIAPPDAGPVDHSVIMVAMGKAAATLVPPKPIAPEPLSQDDEYLRLLTSGDNDGLVITDATKAINTGHWVCSELAQYRDPSSAAAGADVARRLSAQIGITITGADHVVASAVVVYCPEYE